MGGGGGVKGYLGVFTAKILKPILHYTANAENLSLKNIEPTYFYILKIQRVP